MTQTRGPASFFDYKSTAFDAIYSGKKNPLLRLWDKLTRRNLMVRFDFVLRMGKPWVGKRVLDVGCGPGRYGLALAQRGVREVIGVDISTEMVTLANRLAQDHGVADRCRYVRSAALDFEDEESFDVTLAIGFFDYVTDPAPVVMRLRALTDGLLLASFPTRCALRVPFRWVWLRMHGCPIRFYSHREVKSLFEQHGHRPPLIQRSGPIYMVATETRGGQR